MCLNTISHNAKGRVGGGWSPWPISIIAFLCVVVLACAGFVTFCSLNPSELVAHDYYEQEIRHQEKMDRVARAQALPVKASLVYDAAFQKLHLAIPSRPADSVSGTLSMYRASSAGMDRQQPLALDAQGRQTIDASALAAGPWRLSVIWNAHGQSFEFEESFVVKAAHEIGG